MIPWCKSGITLGTLKVIPAVRHGRKLPPSKNEELNHSFITIQCLVEL